MWRKIILVALPAAILLMSGCGNDTVDSPVSTVSPEPDTPNGIELLGLVSGRTFYYIQTDTLTSVAPFGVTVTTADKLVKITGDGNDWIIRDGDQPVINIKLTTSLVVQNGYWRNISGKDTLIYFAAPPTLMKKEIADSSTWNGFTPYYQTESGLQLRSFYIAHFGYHFKRQYAGTEEVLVPAGGFTAHRFDVQLFLDQYDTNPIATVIEYYVSGVGLVRLELNSSLLQRSLSMVNYTDAGN